MKFQTLYLFSLDSHSVNILTSLDDMGNNIMVDFETDIREKWEKERYQLQLDFKWEKLNESNRIGSDRIELNRETALQLFIHNCILIQAHHSTES